MRDNGQDVEESLHLGAVANQIAEVVADVDFSVQFPYQGNILDSFDYSDVLARSVLEDSNVDHHRDFLPGPVDDVSFDVHSLATIQGLLCRTLLKAEVAP